MLAMSKSALVAAITAEVMALLMLHGNVAI